MKKMRLFLLLGAVLGLSACAAVEPVTRNAPPPAPVPEIEAGAQAAREAADTLSVKTEPYNVVQINVDVPRTLKVSERNSYFPNADIVWREDPLGDRYAQVAAIVEDAAERGAKSYDSGRRVVVDIQLRRFHALTQKTRYTIGGTHDIRFYMQVRDAATGAVLEPPRLIETQLKAYGGARAIEAMSRGETQKVRIAAHLARVIERELSVRSLPGAEPLTLSSLSSRGI